jgi:hypothetical protein
MVAADASSPLDVTVWRPRCVDDRVALDLLDVDRRVTVRPRVPLSSQCRQTLSISGWSSAIIASNSVRSAKKVFSAPIDFRILLARTSRLSTPLEIQK